MFSLTDLNQTMVTTRLLTSEEPASRRSAIPSYNLGFTLLLTHFKHWYDHCALQILDSSQMDSTPLGWVWDCAAPFFYLLPIPRCTLPPGAHLYPPPLVRVAATPLPLTATPPTSSAWHTATAFTSSHTCGLCFIPPYI